LGVEAGWRAGLPCVGLAVIVSDFPDPAGSTAEFPYLRALAGWWGLLLLDLLVCLGLGCGLRCGFGLGRGLGCGLRAGTDMHVKMVPSQVVSARL